jgi:hypothetical protein
MKNMPVFLRGLALFLSLTSSVLAQSIVKSVPTTIKTAGVYVLTKSLTYSGAGNAIEIEAPDVTLDLQGHQLSGTGAATVGVFVNSVSDVTIENGAVEGFGTGILFSSTGIANNAESVQQMRVFLNGSGIVLDYPSSCTIQNSTIGSGISGIALNNSAGGNRIMHNFVFGCTTGITTDGYCYLLENYVDTGTNGLIMASTDKYRFNVVTDTTTPYSGGTAITDDNN